MSTEALCEAAASMRCEPDTFALAVADWLEYVADVKADSLMPADQADLRHALTVATAYLGRSS